MRWFSLFQSRPGNDWTPVSNTDDHDETGMDELMRMSMGDYQEHEPGQGTSDQPSDYLEPVFHQSPATVSPATTPALHQTVSHTLKKTLNVSCSCSLPKLAFPRRKWYLILLSFFVFVAFIGINVGLGVYSLVFYKPEQLVIDKSVKSFSIPNHEAYRHYEALMLARKNNASGRFRRSTDTTPHFAEYVSARRDNFEAKEREMLRQTKSALKNLDLDQKIFSNRKLKSVWPDVFPMQSTSEAGGYLPFERPNRRLGRSVTEVDCMREYQSKTRWKMHVVYLAKGDNESNMFTSERLKTAHDIERKIIEHPLFPSFCLRDHSVEKYDPSIQNMHGCVPPNSLLTYFFPSQDEQGTIYYDGMGKNLGDIDSALKLAMNHETFYYYVDEKINKTYQKSHLLRSEILFGAPLQGFPCVGDQRRKDQDDKFRNFVVSYINLLSKASTDKVQVLYGGNEIFDYEVTMSFWSDVRLAIISLVAIFLLMLVLSLSLFLTVVGVVIIALSFPISLFFYRVVFGIDALGILNGAAAFVIIGIGVDDVFVYINIYRQASHIEDQVKRIFYTFKTAGVATFFTSFTTAAAFAANLASAIPAVYEFGLFMSLVVSTCWISVFVLMPPALYLNACCFEPLERCLFSCFSCVRLKAADHDDILTYSQLQASDNAAYQDDDVPMLNIEGDDLQSCGDVNQSGDVYDDAILLLDDPYLVSTEHQQLAFHDSLDLDPVSTSHDDQDPADENKCLGRLIQRAIMFLTDHVVIRWRYFVLGLYLVVLIASCILMAQLRPSTHPPQLFRPDTNLQQLLDLKANFSIIDTLQCDRCSAIYNLRLKPGSSSTKMNQGHTTPAPSPHKTAEAPLGGGATTTHPPPLPGHTTQHRPLNTLDPSPEKETPPAMPPAAPVTTTTTTARLPELTTREPKPPLNPPPFTAPYNSDTTKAKVATSVRNNFNACVEQSCNDLKDRPLLESGATVFVVFGITGVDRSKEDIGHVLEQFKSTATFDPDFGDAFNLYSLNRSHLRELCLVCQMLSNYTDLVKPGSAQCIPGSLRYPPLQKVLKEIPECQALPTSLSVYQHQEPAHAEGGLETKTGRLLWLAFAFESTTSEGQAYFEAYKQYEQWERLMDHIKTNVLSPDSPLKTIYQTSEFWTKVMMEVVAVNSAIYGLVLSMMICVISVAVFTGHAVLLFIVVLTIIVIICTVVGVFYVAGWEMGAVEAVSLSILVGSSVDYCVHIVEGYILAGRKMTPEDMSEKPASGLRQQRTSQAVRHIGVAIICSALTTIIAAIPLTQTFIQPFAKFGTILLINTTVSMVMTLTLAVALMATLGPARYRSTWKSHLIATVSVAAITGAFILALYIATSQGVVIPGPSGSPLFS